MKAISNEQIGINSPKMHGVNAWCSGDAVAHRTASLERSVPQSRGPFAVAVRLPGHERARHVDAPYYFVRRNTNEI